MSTITRRSIRRAGQFKSDVTTLRKLMADATEAGINFGMRGNGKGKRVAHTVMHFGRRAQSVTGIHPTKKATRGRMATVTLFQ